MSAVRKSKLQTYLWNIAIAIIAVIVALPLISVIILAFTSRENIWPHLVETVLPNYIEASILLLIGVCTGTLLIGVITAWLVSMCQFPGRKIFEWALLIPLAMPAYIIAYVYTDLLEYAGPVQGMIRSLTGWQTARDYWFPEIRSLGGAIFMMSLVLFPYVYLLARSAFLEQSVRVLEASRSLGATPWEAFFKIALPLARPSIAVGLALVAMESLNDFGTVDYFAVQTLTAGLYNVWLIMQNRGGAAQIACVLLIFILLLVALERIQRSKKSYGQTGGAASRPQSDFVLGRWQALAAMGVCATPIVLGFVLPASALLYHALMRFSESWTAEFLTYAKNSLMLSGLAALIAVILGTVLAYAIRLQKGMALKLAVRFASLGYAIPGAVLALGVIVPLGAFDNGLDAFMREHFGVSTGLLLSGSLVAITYAYVVRFLALSYGTVEAGLHRIRPTMDMAARTLGARSGTVLKRIHIPLLRGSLVTATMLVFVDGMKELPATLMLRPFDFDTLATYVYQLASDELLEESALAALSIVAVGLLPVILLSRSMGRSSHARSTETSL